MTIRELSPVTDAKSAVKVGVAYQIKQGRKAILKYEMGGLNYNQSGALWTLVFPDCKMGR